MKITYDLYVMTTDGAVDLVKTFKGVELDEAAVAFEKIKAGPMVRAIFLDQAQRVGKSTTKVNVMKWRKPRAYQATRQGSRIREVAQGRD